MLFSVVIPTYNRSQLLRATLDSVFAQTFTDYEVIVVDDGSTDDTREMVAGYGQRLRCFRQENAGPGAARNLAINHANGHYLAFLDSDDLWFPWSLETYASAIRDSDKPAFIAGNPFRFRDEKRLNDLKREGLNSRKFLDYLASGDEWRWWGVSSFVIRTDVMRQSGGFAEANMNGEDGDLALKLGNAGGFVQMTSPFTFAYREHVGNLTYDLSKSLAGVWYKVHEEQAGHYPGGVARSLERWRILTRHIRPIALECVRKKMKGEAWKLYRATLRWHVQLRRWKFIAAFPLRACLPRR
jgi:glycosyltransferase involved in cell wall biosynthesis